MERLDYEILTRWDLLPSYNEDLLYDLLLRVQIADDNNFLAVRGVLKIHDPSLALASESA